MTEQQYHKEMRQKCKNTFSTPEGKDVLGFILFDLLKTFNADLKGEGDLALSNAGKKLLDYVGCGDRKYAANAVIQTLLNLPVVLKTEKKEENNNE